MRRAAFVLLLVGCGGGGGGGGDAGVDGATDAGPSPSLCGDGVVDDGEACDGAPRACADLGGSWESGDAPCRADCLGWEPSSCGRAAVGWFEAVKPASRDARWETARCNDGSDFSFVVRLAAAPTDEWVIYLEGGVMCDDNAFSCAERDPYLTTTLPLADRSVGPIPPRGLFSDDATVNPFASANQVFAHYCSSDFWAGATTEPRPTSAGDWLFSGRANVEAMIQILVERYGLASDAHVLFAGGSAGAFGAHFNIGRVEALLPDANLMLFVDAGVLSAWTNLQHPLGDATGDDLSVFAAARAFWGATYDAACEDARPVDATSCVFAASWYGFVSERVPVFVQQSTFDSSFTSVHGLTAADPDADTWRAQVTAELSPMAWLHTSANPYHVLATTDAGLATGPPGDTLGEMLRRFFDGGEPERVTF